MALLTFPVSPINGQLYPNPSTSLPGTIIYQWSAAEQTWLLLGRTTAVIPGTYGDALQVPKFTVDYLGRITFAQNVPIQLGTTAQIGLVQLVDNTTSNDATKALTAAQGYSLQQQINVIGAWTANDIPLSPTINGNTNVQSALNDALYNITSPGTSIAINEFAVGQVTLDVVPATETQIGGAEIATQAEVDAGTDDTRIITPLKLATYVSSGQINAFEIPLIPAINGSVNVQQALQDTVYSVTSSTLTVTQTPVGQVTIEAPPQLYHYTQLDDISVLFDGVTTSFFLTISGTLYAPNPVGNLMVFLGGVVQIPGAGNAYTISGSSITFNSAPEPGTTFYATTVTNT